MQFCLKIYDLLGYPHPSLVIWVDGCFDKWDYVKSIKIK